VETDLTGMRFSNPNIYNEYQNVIDFVAIRGSKDAVRVDDTTAKLTNVELPILPQELVGTFDTRNWFRVYINGLFITPDAYTFNFNGSTNEIYFTFDLTKVFEQASNSIVNVLENDDEISITGKFIELWISLH